DKRKVTCRVVATGNRAALEEQVRYGRFSMDLLQWLSQSELRMPSLSERREDIPKLVMAILRDFAQREHVAAPSVPYHYMELLMTVSWPENVRQLRNHVESVIALSNGVFDPEIIREHFQPAASSATIKGALHMLWNKLRGASAAPSLNHN
ncbi:hypothetical protein KJ815_05550, partial [bacterium]|nr:hypothetical protein [bacterium]